MKELGGNNVSEEMLLGEKPPPANEGNQVLVLVLDSLLNISPKGLS